MDEANVSGSAQGAGPRASADLLIEHWHWTRGLARQMGAAGDSDDVSQESWLRMLLLGARAGKPSGQASDASSTRGSTGGSTGSTTKGYARAVVRNTVGQWRRSARLRAEHEQGAAEEWRGATEVRSPAELAAAAETGRLLVRAVLDLPTAQRDVLLLRYFEGLSSVEIGRRLSESPATIRSRISRGIEALRQVFADRGEADEQGLLMLAAVGPMEWLGESPAGRRAAASPKLALAAATVAVVLLPAVWSLWGGGEASDLEVPHPAQAAAGAIGPKATPRLTLAGVQDSAPQRRPASEDDAQSLPANTMGLIARAIGPDGKGLRGAQLVLEGLGVPKGTMRFKASDTGQFRVTSQFITGEEIVASVTAGAFMTRRSFRLSNDGVGILAPPTAGWRDFGDVVLGPAGEVRADFADLEGRPISGAQVMLWVVGSDIEATLTTGDDGIALFQHVRPGQYGIVSLSNEYLPWGEPIQFTVKADERWDEGKVTLTPKPKPKEGGGDGGRGDTEWASTEGEPGPLKSRSVAGRILRGGKPAPGVPVTATPLTGSTGLRDASPSKSFKRADLAALPPEAWSDHVDWISRVQAGETRRGLTDAEGRFLVEGLGQSGLYELIAWGFEDHAVALSTDWERRGTSEPNEGSEPAEDSSGAASSVQTFAAGDLRMQAYAQAEIHVRGPLTESPTEPSAFAPSAYEILNFDLGARHRVGADGQGVIRLSRVTAGSHGYMFTGVGGLIDAYCSVGFHAKPGETVKVEADLRERGVTSVTLEIFLDGERLGINPRKENIRPWFFPEDQESPRPSADLQRPGSPRILRLPHFVDGGLRGCVRAMGRSQIVLEVKGRFLDVPGLAPNLVAGNQLDLRADLGNETLNVYLPSKVKEIAEGQLELEGAGTSFSTPIRKGRVGRSWKVTRGDGDDGPDLRVGALSPGKSMVRIRAIDDGLVILDEERPVEIVEGRAANWQLPD